MFFFLVSALVEQKIITSAQIELDEFRFRIHVVVFTFIKASVVVSSIRLLVDADEVDAAGLWVRRQTAGHFQGIFRGDYCRHVQIGRYQISLQKKNTCFAYIVVVTLDLAPVM